MVRVTCPSCGYKADAKANQIRDEFMNMRHFNLDENGVRVNDPTLATENCPNGRIIDIFFKDKKAWCDYDDSTDCKHVQFALSLPVVQVILKKKGWNL
jgi:hypothetical protein